MDNPFQIIDARLSNLENLILDLKHSTIPKLLEKPKHPNPNQFLTKKEAAKLLSCSVSTIDNYRRAGKLKRYNIGSSVRFKRTALLGMLADLNKQAA